jgi:hypothetical protein
LKQPLLDIIGGIPGGRQGADHRGDDSGVGKTRWGLSLTPVRQILLRVGQEHASALIHQQRQRSRVIVVNRSGGPDRVLHGVLHARLEEKIDRD